MDQVLGHLDRRVRYRTFGGRGHLAPAGAFELREATRGQLEVQVEADAASGDAPARHVLRVRGELDLATVPQLAQEVDALLPTARAIVLDIAEISFIDLTAARLIVGLAEICERYRIELRLLFGSCANRLFQLTGLLQALPGVAIRDDRGAAIRDDPGVAPRDDPGVAIRDDDLESAFLGIAANEEILAAKRPTCD